MRTLGSLAAISTLFLSSFMLSSCGGGASSAPTPQAQASNSPIVQVLLGDAPADQVVSFELTINQITLSTGSSTANVLSTPTRVEIIHRDGDFEPLAIANIPAGTYTSATITISNPEVSIVDPVTKTVKELVTTATTNTITITFSPALTINSTQLLSFDLNAASSITISGNTASVTPTFTVMASAPNPQGEQEAENGHVDDFTGIVTSVSGTTFTIATVQGGATMVFNTNGSTQYHGITGFAQITPGLPVEVEGSTQTDGSMLASEVEARAGNVLEAQGIVTSVTGSPATSFTFVPRSVLTALGAAPLLGHETSVNVSGSVTFTVDANNVDLSNLPFTPAFNASTLSKGQAVEVETESAAQDNLPGKRVALKVQTLGGTISALSGTGSPASFTLTVPSDSIFASLTGATTITVYRQNGTRLKGITALANGNKVRVRGLLFNDGGAYKLVAGRILQP